MEGIGQFTAAGENAENFRTACGSGVEVFEHQCASALGHDKAVAILRKGAHRALRRFVMGGEGGQQRKADQGFGVDRAVCCYAKRCVCFATADRLYAELDGGCAGGASGG